MTSNGRGQNLGGGKRSRFFVTTGISLVSVTIFAGVLLTIYSVKKTDRVIRENWLNLLEASAAAVNPDRIRDWVPGLPDFDHPDYIRVEEQFRLISKAVEREGVHPLYLLLKDDGQIYFQIDAASSASPEYAEPGTVYEDAPATLTGLFDKPSRASIGPYEDVYGEFVSSFVSIIDPKTDKVLAVLGADVPAQLWRKTLFARYFVSGMILLLGVGIEVLLLLYFYKHKKFESDLAMSESHFRSIVDASINAIFRTDKKGTIIFMSRAILEMSGFGAEEVIGKNILNFFEKKEQPILFDNFSKVLAGENVIGFEGYLLKKTGEKFFVEFNVVPLFRDGEVVEVQGIIHDITARKQIEDLLKKRAEEMGRAQKAVLNILEDVAEEKDKNLSLAKDLEKFKLAVDNASDHIVITDPEGIVFYLNKAAEKITGYKTEQAIGKKTAVLWKVPMPQEFYVKMWKTIKIQKKTYSGILQNKRKNGEIYDAAVSISPILDEKGDIVFFVGLEKDVTKEREIDRVKTEFVSLASHQLRTPLSTINWYAEMLLAGDAGEMNKEQTGFVNEIYQGNQRMVDLVNALLNVSRLELGTFMVEPKDLDIVGVAETVLKDLTALVVAKKIKLEKQFDKKVGILPLDRKLMDIIFMNLLSNAVKYTPEGGKVKLMVDRKKDGILITVQDTGYGIPVIQQEKIFTKLFRADNARAKDADGTGLGLYIVKSILDNVGGKVWFESKENQGSTFYVKLPLSGMEKKTGTKTLN